MEVDLWLSDGSMGRAMVPSGASKGQHEALELRDTDSPRFGKKGTLAAVRHVNQEIAKLVVGRSFEDVKSLDQAMIQLDGTAQKSHLGANAVLGVSLAFAHAIAHSQKRPLFLVLNEWMGLKREAMRLPVPLMNVINGGEHANNSLEIQEFMIVPHGFESFADALRAGCEVFHTLKKKLDGKKYSTAVGDEGGFAPNLESNEAALALISESIESAGYRLGKQISLALDVAASSFFSAEHQAYEFHYQGKERIDRDRMIEFYGNLVEKFPIVSIEDGLDEGDWTGWRSLTEKFGKRLQLVGDDIFVTQTAFVQRGIEEHVANAVLIKVNQVGSLSETFETMQLAQRNQYRSVVSHRSGETEDVTIAHLAVGSGCGQIKTGSLSRSERTAKYNELLRIEEFGREQGSPIPFARVFNH